MNIFKIKKGLEKSVLVLLGGMLMNFRSEKCEPIIITTSYAHTLTPRNDFIQISMSDRREDGWKESER
jgi:hypothetical protein